MMDWHQLQVEIADLQVTNARSLIEETYKWEKSNKWYLRFGYFLISVDLLGVAASVYRQRWITLATWLVCGVIAIFLIRNSRSHREWIYETRTEWQDRLDYHILKRTELDLL